MSTESPDAKTNAARTRELNDTIRYTMWSVFRLRDVIGDADRSAEATDVEALFEVLAEQDVVVRGLYDVAGLRADADFMIWTHSPSIEALQATYSDFRRTTALGRASAPVWSNVACHRPAGARGLRGGVRRRRHPRGDRLGPAGRGLGHTGRMKA